MRSGRSRDTWVWDVAVAAGGCELRCGGGAGSSTSLGVAGEGDGTMPFAKVNALNFAFAFANSAHKQSVAVCGRGFLVS